MSNKRDRDSAARLCSLPSFTVEIGKHRDTLDAVFYLEKWMDQLPDRKATVTFGGYDDDAREVWEIDRCVDICNGIIDYGLLPRLAPDSAWFVYRTATMMPGLVQPDYMDRFAELMHPSP